MKHLLLVEFDAIDFILKKTDKRLSTPNQRSPQHDIKHCSDIKSKIRQFLQPVYISACKNYCGFPSIVPSPSLI